uniref:Uncharacterized protein n=1 Tax=Parascaris equorum TaxID=6256 RepID=A0A914RQU9_PAREQ
MRWMIVGRSGIEGLIENRKHPWLQTKTHISHTRYAAAHSAQICVR